MPIYALGHLKPEIDSDAWVHPEAVVIGDVRIGPDATIWPGAVLRGDAGSIVIGPRSSIQDNCVLHCRPEEPTMIGADCVVGHTAHIEGARIGDRVLVGSNSVVLGAWIESDGAVAAGAVVLDGTTVPAGSRAQGVPAAIVANGMDPEEVRRGAAFYVDLGRRYRQSMARLD